MCEDEEWEASANLYTREIELARWGQRLHLEFGALLDTLRSLEVVRIIEQPFPDQDTEPIEAALLFALPIEERVTQELPIIVREEHA
jgi:hypothetical protein